MAVQIYLIAPAATSPDSIAARLSPVLEVLPAAALLLLRGAYTGDEYARLATAVRPLAQSHGCAVLLEDEPALARSIEADGVHITGGIKAVREALDTLKPDLIVGSGALQARHDAMTKAEAGTDYVFFGPLSGSPTEADLELAGWWAETFEVPAVLSLPDASGDDVDARGCEFVAFGESVWSDPDPDGIAGRLARAVEAL